MVDELNDLTGKVGWITQNYCDVRSVEGNNRIKMWQRRNGMKADAIRDKIEEWENSRKISHHIAQCLIGILIYAMD